MFYSYLAAPPDHLPHMVNGIGPNTCLWVFVKRAPGKAYGPFFAIDPPGVILIEGTFLQLTAQV